MDKHFEALESDFQSVYGLDLRHCIWGESPMGLRRFSSLVRGLPPRSVTQRALATRGHDWSTSEELLSSLIEMTDMTNRLLFAVNAPKGKKPWKPITVARPTAPVIERKPATPEELKRFFGQAIKYVEGDSSE